MGLKSNLVLSVFLKIALQLLCGPLTFSTYPIPVNAVAFLIIAGLFFLSLYTEDYFSFLMQLFICNHYVFGYENGGIFNVCASFALIAYLIGFKTLRNIESSLGKGSMFLLIAFFIIQVLSLVNSNGPFNLKFIAALSFFNFLFIFYNSSKMKLAADDYYNFIRITGIFFFYTFIVALNQKYTFFQSHFAVFPILNADTEYELNISRSVGTLGNFEYFAEYSISIIALCLPGILSGSFLKVSRSFFFFCMSLIVTAIFSIVLSGTRSSILLLPVLVVFIFLLLGRRLKIKNVIIASFLIVTFLVANSLYQIFDFSVFSKRSESVNKKTLTLSSILSGENMNRGDIFAYGFKKISQSPVLFGSGYYTNRKEYVMTHFDQAIDLSVPDYHNLYLSAIVLWGYTGLAILVFLFISILVKGFRIYRKYKADNFFLVDLLLGFNMLFLFFLINQFKIEFIRDANYFMLMLLMLSFYNSLISLLSENIIVTKNTHHA